MRPESTDAELIDRVLAGDVEAYAPLVHRHYGPCARFARRMLGNAEDAEDALQETFLKAYVGLRRYHERNRFRAWLFSILVNQCRSHARRGRRWASRFVYADGADAPGAEMHGGTDLRDSLQAALDTLEPLLREALLLKYGEELEYEEMSRLTCSSVSALKMRVKRARDAVRPMLKEMLHE